MKARPKFNVSRHLELDAEALSLLEGREGAVLDEVSARVLARIVSGRLSGGEAEARVLGQAFTSFAGEPLLPDDLRRMAELAVSAGFFAGIGRYVDWRECEGLWPAPLMLRSVESARGSRMYRCVVESHGGRSAGERWTRDLPGGFLQNIVRRCGGSRKGRRKDVDAGGLWFFGMVSHTGRITEIFKSEGQRKYNAEILRRRSLPCEKGWWKGAVCFDCPAGRSVCDLARHSETYKWGPCASGDHDGWIVGDGYCRRCSATTTREYKS